MNNKQFWMTIFSLVAGMVLGTVSAVASATEITWGGDIIVRPFLRDNARDFDAAGSANDKKEFTTERARLKANVKVDDDISGVVELLHFRKWGAADPNRVVDANGTPNNSNCSLVAGTATASGVSCSNPALDDNWLDLNQAYIEVKNVFDTGWYTRIGRQEMAYGDQRLIGNTNFWSTYPFPRAYDAVKIGTKNDTFDLDVWAATVTERQLGTLFGPLFAASGVSANNTTEPKDRMFYGAWGTLKTIPDNTVDLYLLAMSEGGYNKNGSIQAYESIGIPPNFGHLPYVSNVGATSMDASRVYNFGARLKGKYGNFDYTVEGNQQNGQAMDGANINANSFATVLGLTVPEAMGLRVSGEYVFASGDENPTAGEHTTFYQFSPSPHMHLGAQDFIAFQNINAWRIGASFNAKPNLKITGDFWDFSLNKANDYWYGSNGISTRAGTSAIAGYGAEGKLADVHVGTEVDLKANYDYSKALSFEAGYSRFTPGSGINNAGTAVAGGPACVAGTTLTGHTCGKGDNANFAWGMLMLKF